MPTVYQDRFSQSRIVPFMFPEDLREIPYKFGANLVLAKGTVLGLFTGSNTNAVQTITPTGTISGGTLLVIFGLARFTIAFNSTAAQVKALFEAALLATYGITGTVTVTGGPLSSGALTFTFSGQMAAQAQPLFQLVSSLTGGGTVAAATTTAGIANGAAAAYDDSLSNGLQIAKAILPVDIATDPAGIITYGSVAQGGQFGKTQSTLACAVRGIFKTTDLVGLDANGVADLGRLLSGTAADGVLSIY
jgi:hypothetical protein